MSDAAPRTVPRQAPDADVLPHWAVRQLPARIPHRGRSVSLEPLHHRHRAELWRATIGHDAIWTWMAYGPFASESALGAQIGRLMAGHDPLAWAVRPHRSGTVEGWLTLMEIDAEHGTIELGHILFAPSLQRTQAATEAMALLMGHAMDELGYRRLQWKCDSRNAPSRAAALRLGFRFEGVLRHMRVVKGRNRDTAMYSILDSEWPARQRAIEAWLSAFDHRGQPGHSLTQATASLPGAPVDGSAADPRGELP